MVYVYYEIGRMIVEEEQNRANRVAYGKQILKELSNYSTGIFGKGYLVDNFKFMRRFYAVYLHDQIEETVFTKFNGLKFSSVFISAIISALRQKWFVYCGNSSKLSEKVVGILCYIML